MRRPTIQRFKFWQNFQQTLQAMFLSLFVHWRHSIQPKLIKEIDQIHDILWATRSSIKHTNLERPAFAKMEIESRPSEISRIAGNGNTRVSRLLLKCQSFPFLKVACFNFLKQNHGEPFSLRLTFYPFFHVRKSLLLLWIGKSASTRHGNGLKHEQGLVNGLNGIIYGGFTLMQLQKL